MLKITGLEGVCSLLKQQSSLHYCRNYHHSLISIPASSQTPKIASREAFFWKLAGKFLLRFN